MLLQERMPLLIIRLRAQVRATGPRGHKATPLCKPANACVERLGTFLGKEREQLDRLGRFCGKSASTKPASCRGVVRPPMTLADDGGQACVLERLGEFLGK